MSLPTNFSRAPGENSHRVFRNVCVELKRTIQKTPKNKKLLLVQMDRFLDASKNMHWKQSEKNKSVYHKDEKTKAVDRVFEIFKRYLEDVEDSPQALLDAVTVVEDMFSE